jgi:Family of unknown function (DUF6807)
MYNQQSILRESKSGTGLPHSKTLRVFQRLGLRASVLECGSPVPLWMATVGLLVALVHSSAAANLPVAIASNAERGELVITYKGQKLLVYAFATNQFKPYVRELYTLRGENVLRDAVPDHPHHHGLMYGICVNGTNFWEEQLLPGVEKHVEMPMQLAHTDSKGVPTAHFIEVIHWLAPTNRNAADSLKASLLQEQRTITLTVEEKSQEIGLRWESQFRVGPKAGKLTLQGATYHGLGLRLPESFNHVATFQNSANHPYTGQNTQNVIPAQWTSVSGKMDGHEVMLAMFGRPDNARGNAGFFTMTEPFAYLSATQLLDKKPLEYAAGDEFNLSYLLTVYSENKPAQFIRQRCDLWEKERR